MVLNTFSSGVNTSFSSELNSNSVSFLKASGRNLIRELQDRAVDFSADGGEWAEAYSDADGRLDSVESTSADFDTDNYAAVTSSTEPFVIIEATSLTASDFAINDCKITFIDTGKWLLRCTSGTDEVKRAQIYKTLFYGSNGLNPRASSTFITGITALKTNVIRDVGKRAYNIVLESANNSDIPTSTAYTVSAGVTFTDTTNNTDFSSWSNFYNTAQALYNTINYAYWEVPDGTKLNQVVTISSGTSNSYEIGTDTTADEIDNPADAEAKISWGEDAQNDLGSSKGYVVFICSGAATVSITGDTSATGIVTADSVDFYTDEGIPVMTAVTEDYVSSIYHNIPSGIFSSTISSCIGTFLAENWETGANVQYKLTNSTEDTGWLNTNEIAEFTAFTAEPDTCIVKLIPKSSSPTSGYPSIKGFNVFE
jgi:hypothetical protein